MSSACEPESNQYQQLIKQIRCVTCPNQSIADSQAPVAVSIKELVRQEMCQHRSEAQIKAFLVERYGDAVLFEPPTNAKTALLWMGPFALAISMLIGIYWLWRKRQ